MEPTIPKISIPRDIIFDIFSILPVKSLMRFKSVSKFCNSLISESVFVDRHQYRTSRVKFIVRQRAKLYTIEAMEEGKVLPLPIDNFCEKLFYNNIMCVNGLFCCSMEHMERVTICNLSTKVVTSLPRLKERPKIEYPEYFYSMGFDEEKKTYIVLMTINGYVKHVNPTRNWVFTLGRDESWREIKCITDFVCKNAVCVNGVIYMLSYSKPNVFVLGFVVKSENFRMITLWNSLDEHIGGSYYNLIKVNGKVGIIKEKNLYLDENWEVWILGKEEWEWEKHIIGTPAQDWTSREFITFCGTCEGEILLTNKSVSCQFICFCYNVTEKRWRKFEIQQLSEESSINAIYSYDESLFPVERICNSVSE